jgi:biotin carboxyl carrier protein
VGLIEVMKTFNAVRAGVSGIVTEMCVPDSALVEYGQALLRVRPKAR